MFRVRYWIRSFGGMARGLPVVAAYLLCGTDFIATLHSLTALNVVEAFHSFAEDPSNAPFMENMGAGRTGSPGQVFDT